MKIQLNRELGYHLVQTYVPSIVFVTLSWLALFVSADSIPGMHIYYKNKDKIGIVNQKLRIALN